jgi:hypothetical protein
MIQRQRDRKTLQHENERKENKSNSHQQTRIPTSIVKINVDGADIEQVKNFNYLGHKISEDDRCEEDIKRRIGIAKTAF